VGAGDARFCLGARTGTRVDLDFESFTERINAFAEIVTMIDELTIAEESSFRRFALCLATAF
jgi:hypothetical protein